MNTRMRLSGLSFLTMILALAIAAGDARAHTWHVNAAHTGDAPTLQAAVDSAAVGDSILVAPGTYTWTNQGSTSLYGMVFLPRGKDRLVIRSEAGPAATIMDGQGRGRVFFVQGWNYLTLEGFTIQNGVATTQGNFDGGGLEMHLSYEIVRNCIFRNNSATAGGAVWCGGVSAPQFIDCEFVNNQAYAGGALYFINSNTPPTIRGCRIHHNTATSSGGGIDAVHNGLVIENCDIALNTAGVEGGGVYFRNAWPSSVTACTIAENEAPTGSGVYALATPSIGMTRCAVVFGAGGAPYASINGSLITASCGDTYGNPGSNAFPAGVADGGDNFSANPLFCSGFGSMNYSLDAASPCLPGQHPGGASCALVGNHGTGCGTVAVTPATWGQVKALYR